MTLRIKVFGSIECQIRGATLKDQDRLNNRVHRASIFSRAAIMENIDRGLISDERLILFDHKTTAAKIRLKIGRSNGFLPFELFDSYECKIFLPLLIISLSLLFISLSYYDTC